MQPRPQDSPDDRCLAQAKGSHGLITYRQAREAGKSPSSINRKVSSREWIVLLPRVYLFDPFPRTWQQRALGAQLWGGATCCICGPGAAYLHKMLEKPPRVIDIALEGSTRSSADWIRTHNRQKIEVADLL